ncbi:MAG: Tim44/TimA family putative adaptor protein [Wolbachia endosymbiont of Fragariocoptes setiger]|nr:Tim44/TimA family putative adaptor protein [Wolbachia endosymbiont of Fragariocoptes setiger]
MIEFVIYALLTAFIFSRLYNSLGKSIDLKKLTDILDIVKTEEVVSNNEQIYIDQSNSEVYEQILKKDKNFSISHFIQGASIAFELIIKYYNHGDLENLKPLVSKDLLNDFSKKIKQREKLGEIHESVIVSIISQEIVEMKLVKNTLSISVKFLSEQINFVQDNNGNILSGSRSIINKFEDIWQFSRNIHSSDPGWLLISINKKADAA